MFHPTSCPSQAFKTLNYIVVTKWIPEILKSWTHYQWQASINLLHLANFWKTSNRSTNKFPAFMGTDVLYLATFEEIFPLKLYTFLSFPSTIYKLIFSNENHLTILWHLPKSRSSPNVTFVRTDMTQMYKGKCEYDWFAKRNHTADSMFGLC
jgi:hypothetical protein